MATQNDKLDFAQPENHVVGNCGGGKSKAIP